jgi:hypothetical protein
VLLVFVGLLLAATVLSLVRVFMLCSVAQLRLALMPCIGLYLLLLLNARAGHLPFSVKKKKSKPNLSKESFIYKLSSHLNRKTHIKFWLAAYLELPTNQIGITDIAEASLAL